jgi:hypothetical protein
VAGVRDPVLISKIDSVINDVKKQVDNILKDESAGSKVFFHVYGKNAVMDSWERARPAAPPLELGIVIEAVAPTQAQADTVCGLTRSTFLHFGYEGRISTAGNLAFPFSPSDMRAGEAREFSIYHIMRMDDEDKFFKVRTLNVSGGAKRG